MVRPTVVHFAGGIPEGIPVAGQEVNEAMVQQVVRFGFDATQAATALERAGGDLNAALDCLL